MKSIALIILIIVAGPVLARIGAPYMSPWVVIADSVDTSIPAGTCVVTGFTFLHYVSPIVGATVATVNRSASAISDSTGRYSLNLHEADSAIFFYHPEHGETVIWNYDFKSQHRVTINFYARQQYEGNQMVKKPVIYLYSDVETEVTLSIRHPNITFTYPIMNPQWQVTTLPGGTVLNAADGKAYPYLFWEGESKVNYYTTSETIPGQLLSTDTLVSFLEHNLSAIGLNEKEQADFITFWAPQLVQKPYVFIQFLVDKQYDEMIAGLDVCPKPDAQLRVFMSYHLMELPFVPFKYEPQIFSSFERSGLTLIEWGGAELPGINPVP